MTETNAAPVAAERARPRLEVLDGLRFVAALIVLMYHFTAVRENGIWPNPPKVEFPQAHLVTFYGWLGVNLFFLISGFVICMSSWGRSLGEFFTSRVARLFPAFWFSVLATTALRFATSDYAEPNTWLNVLLNLTMLQEPYGGSSVSAVYWTLWEELRFYLLFAIVVWRGVTYRRVVYFCCIWTVASVGATAAGMGNDTLGPGLDLIIPDYSPLFVAGIACYLMYRFGPNLLLWGIIGLSFVLSLPVTMRKHARVEESQVQHLIARWPTALLMGLIFLVVIATALGWLSWIRGAWLTVLGTTTYPLYLLHETIGGTTLHYFAEVVPRWVALGIVTLGLILLSWLVHRYVELPVGRRLKTRIGLGVRDLDLDVEPLPESAPASVKG
ncbi:acyltransferase family protein [Micromonosporaceae bacterium Da 78-11]